MAAMQPCFKRRKQTSNVLLPGALSAGLPHLLGTSDDPPMMDSIRFAANVLHDLDFSCCAACDAACCATHRPSSFHLSVSLTKRGTTRVRMGMGGLYLATSWAVRPAGRLAQVVTTITHACRLSIAEGGTTCMWACAQWHAAVVYKRYILSATSSESVLPPAQTGNRTTNRVVRGISLLNTSGSVCFIHYWILPAAYAAHR